VPIGKYDTGDGFLDADSGSLFASFPRSSSSALSRQSLTDARYTYEGMLLRQATQPEVQWVVANCRATRRLADPSIPS
jgi:hypothetical protein